MPFSLHSHSGQFCEHATGNLEEIIQEAIKKKFLIYGLSEHCPRYRAQDLYPEESHLQPSDLSMTFSKFVIEARHLQEKYKSHIKLIVGLETENITDSTTTEMLDLISKYKLEYIVGSVHHVHETPIDFDEKTFEIALSKSSSSSFVSHDDDYSYSPEESLFLSYFDSQYQMLQHLKPIVVGHFDVIRIYRPKFLLTNLIWQKIERNIDFIINYGGLFEINSAGFKYFTDAYPLRDILKLIIQKGGKFTISDDSHGPLKVGQNYDQLYNYLKEFNIDTLHYLDYDDDDENEINEIIIKDKKEVKAEKGNLSSGRKIVIKEMRNVLKHSFWNQFL